jgi:hypothetical protein
MLGALAAAMKVMLTIVMMSVLMLGGQSLKCYVCAEFKLNGKVDKDISVACDEASKNTCEEGEVCETAKVSYAVVVGEESDRVEGNRHGCAEKATKGGDDSTCKAVKEKVDTLPGFKDFKCSTKYCDTDLCNAGNVAQISFFLLAAIVAFFGQF